MKLVKLFLRMLRYRVASMLLLFYFLAIAFHHKLLVFSFSYLLAAAILSASYVAATTINDIADKDIDRINHPGNKGRPLVTNEASEKDIYLAHTGAVSLAILFAYFLGIHALIITALSLCVNYLYSIRPVRFSYRTFAAPLLLAVAYVGIPYCLGLVTSYSTLQKDDLLFLPALLFLFIGRIILKDFRDRKGDAKYGKPTFLLRFGKHATCIASLTALITGNILLVFLFLNQPLFGGLMEIYFICMYISLYHLTKSSEQKREQTAIGIGAKMGNGLLIFLLSSFILESYRAPMDVRFVFLATLVLLFLYNFYQLMTKPQFALIGYKG